MENEEKALRRLIEAGETMKLIVRDLKPKVAEEWDAAVSEVTERMAKPVGDK